MKENRSYHGVANFKKEASLKARIIAIHPLVIFIKFLRTKAKCREITSNDEVGKKKLKKEIVHEEKQQKQVKRENYISKYIDNK